MGHHALAEQPFQCTVIIGQKIDIIADLVLHGNDLGLHIGNKALHLGKLFQNFRFLDNAVGKILEIGKGCGGTAVCAGKQKGIELYLRCGDGNNLNYVLFIRVLLHGRAAAHAVVVADRITHSEIIQHGGDQFRL